MLQPINVGDPITANFLNGIINAINAIDTGTGAAGPIAASLAAVLSVIEPDIFVPVRIIRTRAGGTPIQEFDNTQPPRQITNTYFPSFVSYDVKALRAPWEVEDIAPSFGRDVRNDEARVYPARTGLIAFMIRAPKMRESDGEALGKYSADLMLLPGSEVVARRRCNPPAPILRAPNGLPLPLDLPLALPGVDTAISTPNTQSQSQGSEGSGAESSGNQGGSLN